MFKSVLIIRKCSLFIYDLYNNNLRDLLYLINQIFRSTKPCRRFIASFLPTNGGTLLLCHLPGEWAFRCQTDSTVPRLPLRRVSFRPFFFPFCFKEMLDDCSTTLGAAVRLENCSLPARENDRFRPSWNSFLLSKELMVPFRCSLRDFNSSLDNRSEIRQSLRGLRKPISSETEQHLWYLVPQFSQYNLHAKES